MEESSDASASGPDEDPSPSASAPRPFRTVGRARLVALTVVLVIAPPIPTFADALARVRASGRLTYGADEEGGAPYCYRDAASRRRVGFEVELMERVGRA